MSLADLVLADLLKRTERALVRGSDRAIQAAFTNTNSPYWQQNYEQRQRCHARLTAAERAGAVQLRWAKQGGEDRPLEKVRLLNADKLAAFLGTVTHSDAVREAQAVLSGWLPEHTRVAELLEAWTKLKSPRGFAIDSAPDFADALRVLDAMKQEHGNDQIVRVLSRALFQDTKRIEALSRHIDLLTAEHLASPSRQQEEVFNALGLVKEPQPFLVAGRGGLRLCSSQDCPITWPFVGVSNQHVIGYSGAPAWVLSIENLTTFHQASQHLDAGTGLILYTGGMPSPSWCRAYVAILEAISEQIPVYHWGDIDLGGFRIAAHIKNKCIHRHAFLPWLMDAEQLDRNSYSEATEVTRGNMARHARDAGWEILSQRMLARTIEQEAIAVRLPTATPIAA
ncbi:Wadjet anti-phage system protein JetD domain-containing protein [Pseudoxanthomonas sp. UTMC 1351]|uniref:Wadjet anti-phage system protein JetD domain-containing protein n=1 Tax=Pseudoxanthomonas sp. UTMC 1351 TaxID=2695853 RepID=UPI0034CDBEED